MVFSRVWVINLDRRADRWAAFQRHIAAIEWPFCQPERFRAVDGAVCRPPSWWKAGDGAWGCFQSHVQVVEQALLDGCDSVLVLEDDAIFTTNFKSKFDKFISEVPSNWDQLYLGGEHLNQRTALPVRMTENVLSVYNVNRSHAYALNANFLSHAYQNLTERKSVSRLSDYHVDHRYGLLHESGKYNVYAPVEWLVGQRESFSDIEQKLVPSRYWNRHLIHDAVDNLSPPPARDSSNGGNSSPSILMQQEGELYSAADDLLTAHGSRHFADWLRISNVSLAFTTGRAGKVFLVGVKPDGRLAIIERSFPSCMGLAISSDAKAMLLSSGPQLLRLNNVLPSGGGLASGEDAFFAPHQSWITGLVDSHEVGFDSANRPIFVNTLFSCIAAVSEGHSFKPLWKPSFISQLRAEDRCHLNGMALEGGVPRYATAVAVSDLADGWRSERMGGGVVIDVQANEIVARELSLPHSPRIYQGKLWILNSGTGEFGSIDVRTGKFDPVVKVPAFVRGLTFIAGYAVIGISRLRQSENLSEISLNDGLAAGDSATRCGIIVVDLARGSVTDWLWLDGIIREVYDVVVLPNVAMPALLGLQSSEINTTIAMDDEMPSPS